MLFDAPASWDGTCDKMNPVGPGLAKSLTIDPITVKQEWCPVLPSPPKRALAPVWLKEAVACHADGTLRCNNPDAKCLPKPDLEWRVCVYHEGDVDCPNDFVGRWDDKHVFYDPIHGVDDQRKCTDCTCGPPTGSMCTAQLYSYTDDVCGALVDPGYTIASTGPKCVDIIPPGQPLLSKSATPTTYVPGACNAIQGVATGTITKINPSTLCCRL
jgi:hypothetical protein